MILSWMVYTVLVGLVVTAAAMLAERVLLLLRRPVRWVWAAALSASILIPTLSHFFPSMLPVPAVVANQVAASRQSVVVRAQGSRTPAVARIPVGSRLDRGLILMWVVGTMGLGQLMLYSLAVLRGRRREWRAREVNGVEVLVAPEFGPAVVGWRRLQIVLPDWVLALPPDARALVVRHEVEHLDRRDPRLLLQAFLVVLALPWNPAVWWQFRRLRRAIELDCDARVIGSGVSVARYGEVLIEAAGLCRPAGLPALATFAERSSDMQARIEALAPITPRRRGLRIVLGTAAAAILAVAACMVPDPLSPDVSKRLAEAAADTKDSPANFQWVRAHLEGMGPAQVVILVRNPTGQLLGRERLLRTAPGGRPERAGGGQGILEEVPSNSIESIEVIKGGLLVEFPGIEGVIVVTLKAGVRFPMQVGGLPHLPAPSWVLRQLVTVGGLRFEGRDAGFVRSPALFPR